VHRPPMPVAPSRTASPSERSAGGTSPAINALLSGIALISLLLLGPAPAVQAQVILNTERFQLTDVDGFHAGADLSGSLQRGNTELLDVSTSGIVGYRTDSHWIRAIFGGKYLSDDDRSILDQQYLQLRYSWLISPQWRTFHFVQMQKNESLRLRSRWLLGSGIRRSFVASEHTRVDLGTGVMAEWERLDPDRVAPEDDTSLDALRMANLAVITRTFESGARLVNIFYLQPDLSDFSDTRILNDLGLTFPVVTGVNARMSLEWRRDTRPPSVLERDDLSIGMGLGISVR
jgi:hypothetical protein